jgi:hypothetical protein
MSSTGSTFDRSPLDGQRWRSRRGVAVALRGVVLLAPVAVSVAASFVVTRLIPAPHGVGARVAWLVLVVFLCGLLAWPARRQLRRLLPLAALLELSILFPGEAPSRWRVAREAGSIKHLELLADGVPDSEPVHAATTILALVASLARHDRVTRGHSDRVRVFTDMITAEMGLPRADCDRLRWAALIHDIGKLEVPAKLLRKPGKPTADEWESLRLHPEVGARLAAPLAGWLGEHAAVVVQHHERFDGSGYPAGLRGDQISLGARIVGLADAFEVMTAARPYKKAFSRTTALREVVACSGTHFDPDVVRALLAVSTPRLRRALGPASWIGQLPVVGTAPAGGLPAVAGTVARGAGTVMLGGVASAVVVGGAGGMSAAAAPASSHSAYHDPGTSSGWVGSAPQVVVTGPNTGSASGTSDPAPMIPAQRTAEPTLPAGTAPVLAGVTQGRSGEAPQSAPSTAGGSAGSGATSATSSPKPSSSAGGTGSSGTGSGGTGLGGTLQQVTSGVGDTVSGVGDTLGDTVGGVVGGVGDTLDGVVGGVGDTIGGPLGDTASGVGDTLGSTVNGVGDTLGDTVGGVGDTLGSTVNGLGGTVSGLLGGNTGGSTSTTSTTSATPAPSPSPTKSGGLGGLLGKLLGG